MPVSEGLYIAHGPDFPRPAAENIYASDIFSLNAYLLEFSSDDFKESSWPETLGIAPESIKSFPKDPIKELKATVEPAKSAEGAKSAKKSTKKEPGWCISFGGSHKKK